MSFFRSESMSYCQMVLHEESAFDCLVELGYLGKVQFINDYSNDQAPNMKFVNEVQRCADMQRIIQRLQEEINKSEMESIYYPNVDAEHVPKSQDLAAIETILQKLDAELSEIQRHCDALQEKRVSIIERREVLLKTQEFLSGSRNTESMIATYESLMVDLLRDGSSMEGGMLGDKLGPLHYLAGTIPIERIGAFEQMIWRVSRGNAYVKRAMFDLTEEVAKRQKKNRYKFVFLVVFMGNELQKKITKICQGFQAKLYSCPATERERLRGIQDLDIDLRDLRAVFEKTCEHKRRILSAATEDLYIWRSKLKKINAAYFALNRLGTLQNVQGSNQKYLKTGCWIPKDDLPGVRAALFFGARRTANGDEQIIFPPILNEQVHPYLKPPTYFHTNKFTYGFQNLIDSYGIASYHELNPAPYTIITFPFLFAVMFGDVGHGILMTLFALLMIIRERKIEQKQKESVKSNEIFNLLFAGRYIILLMGIFSIYTGFIYNDVLSKSMNIFGSSWQVNTTKSKSVSKHDYEMDPSNAANYGGTPYVFGIDPIWNVSKNVIIMTNSFKMKVAIILGVTQMIFGLVLSAQNALFFHNRVDFFLVFLPQITFLCCLFFYLVFLIFHKWLWYGGYNKGAYGSGCAPSILIIFINTMLVAGADEPAPECNEFFYSGQEIVQLLLVLTAFLTIPILLCGKPVHFMYEHRRIKRMKDKEKQTVMRRNTLNKIRKSLIYNVGFTEATDSVEQKEPEEKLSEVWIHQAIHTIESVLGSVSHTASYLRLWALSLAHNQLSHVLWKMVLGISLRMQYGFLNAIPIFLCFGFFAILTVAILVVMEGLSAFLHTLRLHWVEFQSKFYSGMGESFAPFFFEPSRKSDAET